MRIIDGIKFLELKDLRECLHLGNQTCLDLCNKPDFPAIKLGKSWLIMESEFIEYFKTYSKPK